MAYKYQPIKDEMFVSDDEAVSKTKTLAYQKHPLKFTSFLRSWMRQMLMMVTQSLGWLRVSLAKPMVQQHLSTPRRRPGLARPARLSR